MPSTFWREARGESVVTARSSLKTRSEHSKDSFLETPRFSAFFEEAALAILSRRICRIAIVPVLRTKRLKMKKVIAKR
jgi:hypothetical protein